MYVKLQYEIYIATFYYQILLLGIIAKRLINYINLIAKHLLKYLNITGVKIPQ